MSDERLELVTDFAALGPGMLVVMKRCLWCPSNHRGMLTMFKPANDGFLRVPSGERFKEARWLFEPQPRRDGVHHDGRVLVISAGAVAEGRIYRVVDGLDPEADAEQETKDSVAILQAAAARWGATFERLGK